VEGTYTFPIKGRPSALSEPAYRLAVTGPDGVTQTIDAKGLRIRVGTLADNDVAISDKAVSRIHFEIVHDEKGARLRDLESTNGTFVNGLRVVDAYLPPSANIGLGKTHIEFRSVESHTEVALSEADHFGPLLGQSTRMRELFAALGKVAPTHFTVLVEGETGTGKELVAEAVHQASGRPLGPLVVFDCSAVSPSLLESMLFGHEKGAFTGAHDRHIGCLEEADGGTLFLDELGELPLDLQSKLLRALEKGEFRRVGGQKTLSTDTRLLAATNRDLAKEVNKGTFRADLYYRVAVVRVVVPALRERKDDLEMLIRHFARTSRGGDDATAEAFLRGLGDAEWTELKRHTWPGNVRELRNFVHRRLAMGDGLLDELNSMRAPEGTMPAAPMPALEDSPSDAGDLDVRFRVNLEEPYRGQKQALVDEFERKYILAQLDRCGGVVSHAARDAGMDRMYYHKLLKRLR